MMKAPIFLINLLAECPLMPHIGKGPLILLGLFIFFGIEFEIEDMLVRNEIIEAIFIYMQMNVGVKNVSF